MCPHLSLNSLHPSVPPSSSLSCSFNTEFLFGTVVLLPFPHALLALLQGWAGLETGLGPGASKSLPGKGQATLTLLPLEGVGISMPDPKWAGK